MAERGPWGSMATETLLPSTVGQTRIFLNSVQDLQQISKQWHPELPEFWKILQEGIEEGYQYTIEEVPGKHFKVTAQRITPGPVVTSDGSSRSST